MRTNIIAIYRIETENSVYEIKVVEHEQRVGSVCKKMGSAEEKKQVRVMGTEYLQLLRIGERFKIPGLYETSPVTDYEVYEKSHAPKRRTSTEADGIRTFFREVTEHVTDQIAGKAIMAD